MRHSNRAVYTDPFYLTSCLNNLLVKIFGSAIWLVHLNFRAESTFPVPVCTVPHRHWVNEADNQQD